mgnify:CR=1 FL=1
MSSKSTFSNSTSKSYALALYELAKENSELKKAEDEMIGIKTLLRESSNFNAMILDPTVTKEEKNKVIIKIVDQYGFCQVLKKFLGFLTMKNRLFFLNQIIDSFLNLVSTGKGELKAKLVSSKELSTELSAFFLSELLFDWILLFAMFFILFKNIKLSLIGVVPNFIAAFFILGIIGIVEIPLDMMTITIAAITIGIAVDNSIHYIYRFKEEFNKIKNYNKTLEICHDTVGVAILNTSITIIFGFSILVLSNFIPTIYFGVFTGIAMLLAMTSVLTLLPALIILMRGTGSTHGLLLSPK